MTEEDATAYLYDSAEADARRFLKDLYRARLTIESVDEAAVRSAMTFAPRSADIGALVIKYRQRVAYVLANDARAASLLGDDDILDRLGCNEIPAALLQRVSEAEQNHEDNVARLNDFVEFMNACMRELRDVGNVEGEEAENVPSR